MVEASERDVQEWHDPLVIKHMDAFLHLQRQPLVMILTDSSRAWNDKEARKLFDHLEIEETIYNKRYHPMWQAEDVRRHCLFNSVITVQSKSGTLIAHEWIQIPCRMAVKGAAVKVTDIAGGNILFEETPDLVMDIFGTLLGETLCDVQKTYPVWPSRHHDGITEFHDLAIGHCLLNLAVICVDSQPREAFTRALDGYDTYIESLDISKPHEIRVNSEFHVTGREELFSWALLVTRFVRC
ncbi:hypothetical protein C8J56DRAFT_1176640 [Mycena floridula]|nr:hypothetical protein C8J56DRAFT_1176640 [Mycena floridula]